MVPSSDRMEQEFAMSDDDNTDAPIISLVGKQSKAVCAEAGKLKEITGKFESAAAVAIAKGVAGFAMVTADADGKSIVCLGGIEILKARLIRDTKI